MESNNFQYEGEMKWENAGAGVVRQIMATMTTDDGQSKV